MITLEHNISKLNKFLKFKPNWNGYNAFAFNPLLIQKCKELLKQFKVQPLVYPTAIGCVQLEFETDKYYLEVEVYLNHYCYYIEEGDYRHEEDNVSTTHLQSRFHDLFKNGHIYKHYHAL